MFLSCEYCSKKLDKVTKHRNTNKVSKKNSMSTNTPAPVSLTDHDLYNIFNV